MIGNKHTCIFQCFELCGNPRGAAIHFRDVQQVPILVALLVNLKGYLNVVDVTLLSILWDTIFHCVLLQEVANYNPSHGQPLSSFGTTGQWIPPGQDLWQAQSLNPPSGNLLICPVPTQSTTPPVQIPPTLHLPLKSHHLSYSPSQPALPIHHSYTPPTLCHHPHPREMPPTHSTPTPSKGDIDFKALEARLEVWPKH